MSAWIEVSRLTVERGGRQLVSDVSFAIEPGHPSVLVGPSGAGKTVILRSIVGLVRPTGGHALIEGSPYRMLEAPAFVVGFALANATPDPRGARALLEATALGLGVRRSRVDEVLQMVGLDRENKENLARLAGGAWARVELARAVVADPPALIVDGIDDVEGGPEDLAWIRAFLSRWVAEGRGLLAATRRLSRMEPLVRHAVIVNDGRVLFDGPTHQVLCHALRGVRLRVDRGQQARLVAALEARGLRWTQSHGGWITVPRTTVMEVGAVAREADVALTTLTDDAFDVDEVVRRVTSGLVRP